MLTLKTEEPLKRVSSIEIIFVEKNDNIVPMEVYFK